MLNSLRFKNINCEEEAKFTQDRILFAEKNLAELCDVFAQYSRKVARVRDKGDLIAQTLFNFANSENINKSLSQELLNFASRLAVINDYGDSRVQYIDNKIVSELSQYESVCKQAKEEVKYIFNARDKELIRKKQLDRIRERNPRNRQQIIQAETELVKATSEVSRTIHNLDEKITAFESQKLHSIKMILLNFITIEMSYYAKTLEQLTVAYQNINSINEEADLQAFQNVRESKETDFMKSLQNLEVVAHKQKPEFRNAQSLGSINTVFSGSHKQQKYPGIPVQSSSKQSIYKSSETLDSIKRDVTESSETNSYQENTSDDNSDEHEEKASPFIAKKYLA